jgi:alkylated DNA repair dioxygenase AlkB
MDLSLVATAYFCATAAAAALDGKKMCQRAAAKRAASDPSSGMPVPKSARRQQQHPIARSVLDQCVEYYPRAVPIDDCRRLAAKLRQLPLEQGKVIIQEKELPEARLSLAASMTGQPYMYAGKTNHPVAFTPELLEIKTRVEKILGGRVSFDLALVGFYRNGDDHLGWHSDDPTDIDLQYIASLSLGAERKFKMRVKADHSAVSDYTLRNGDLLLMKGPCQDILQHQVPPSKHVAGERINITLRCYKKPTRPVIRTAATTAT